MRPASGEAKPESSLTKMAKPSVERETSNPRAIVARNNGANRYAALATSLAMVTAVMLRRISLSKDSLSRTHFARFLVDSGYVKANRVFDKFLTRNVKLENVPNEVNGFAIYAENS